VEDCNALNSGHSQRVAKSAEGLPPGRSILRCDAEPEWGNRQYESKIHDYYGLTCFGARSHPGSRPMLE